MVPIHAAYRTAQLPSCRCEAKERWSAGAPCWESMCYLNYGCVMVGASAGSACQNRLSALSYINLYSMRIYRSSPDASPRAQQRGSARLLDQDGPSHTAAVARTP